MFSFLPSCTKCCTWWSIKCTTFFLVDFLHFCTDERGNNEDNILIKNLWESKMFSSRSVIKEFHDKNWKRRTFIGRLYPKVAHITDFIEHTACGSQTQSPCKLLDENYRNSLGEGKWIKKLQRFCSNIELYHTQRYHGMTLTEDCRRLIRTRR